MKTGFESFIVLKISVISVRSLLPFIDGFLEMSNNKQIFHAFLFNIRNYSPEVINIQRREAELNIILPRVNNFDIKQKKARNICFIICHQHQTTSGKIKTTKQQISVKRQVFFRKNCTTTYLTTTPSKSFYIVFLDIFF